MSKEIEAQWFLIAYYDGYRHDCFDEDRYDFEHFNEAYERYNYHNSFVNKKGLDYVKLFAYINEDIGLVLIGDFKPII